MPLGTHTLLLLLLVSCDPNMGPAPDHCPDAESSRITTQDGAQIALHRHRNEGPPVLVIHGISSNHRFWDLTAGHSIAEALVDDGFDPWLLDLRGHGDALRTETGARQHFGWTIDDYAEFDVSAAMAHIQRTTGHSKVALIGHSLGGMVAAMYATIHGDEAVAALVTVASPVVFPDGDFQTWLHQTLSAIGTVPRSIPTPAVARFMAGWHPALPVQGDAVLFNHRNMAEHMQQTMLRRVVSPTTQGELQQLHRMLKAGRLVSADGRRDYSAQLSDLTVPLLAIGGGGDRIAPKQRILPWATATGSEDVTVLMADTASGFAADYGHLDLVLGPAAPREVLQPIVAWLSERRDHW